MNPLKTPLATLALFVLAAATLVMLSSGKTATPPPTTVIICAKPDPCWNRPAEPVP